MSEYQVWIESTDVRRSVHSASLRRAGGASSIALCAARGGRVSCRVVVHRLSGTVPEYIDIKISEHDGLKGRARRIGYVPLPHYTSDTDPSQLCDYGITPTMVPDPLFEDTATVIGTNGEVAYRLRFDVECGATPGTRDLTVTIVESSKEACARDGSDEGSVGQERSALAKCHVDFRIHNMLLEKRNGLEATHWFYADAIHDWYGFDTFDDGYWEMVRPYMGNLIDHGIDVLYTPMFSTSTDGDRRPAQLLDVQSDGDSYRFDFDYVDRYIELGKAAGFEVFEFPHLFSQWGVKNAVPIFAGHGDDGKLLIDSTVGALSDTYGNFLSAFLPKLRNYLESKNLLSKSRFHISDEPHGEEDKARYIAARKLICELAPWMKTMDAVSELAYGSDGLTDLPIPVISRVNEYIARGIHCGTYFCCAPKGNYTNRFLDTPVTKTRALGWLLYRYRSHIHMLLHWGYNYWYRSQTRELIDPFVVTDGGGWPGWTYGDTFQVYPGKNGPIDSIRWEAFAEGLEDYRLLQTSGIEPDSVLLEPLAGFDEFPEDPGWYDSVRGAAFSAGDT